MAGRNQRPPKWRDRPYRFLDWTLNAVDTFLTGDVITGTGVSFCKNPPVNNVLRCQLFPRRPTESTQSQCTPSKGCFAEINQLIQSPHANAHDCQAFRAVTAVRLCIRANRTGPKKKKRGRDQFRDRPLSWCRPPTQHADEAGGSSEGTGVPSGSPAGRRGNSTKPRGTDASPKRGR